ncbi:MAG: hypothetical protein IT381_15610 [Deltaproteobacteria bacterium]|nr:hypothetical protein [Deltaproteobacteria bacterium]
MRALIEAVRPALGALVTDRSFAKVVGVAEQLPRELSKSYGFEYRFGGEGVDFLFSVNDAERSHAILSPSVGGAPAWAPVLALFDAWQRAPLQGAIRNIWLELDTSAAPAAAPSVFIRPVAHGIGAGARAAFGHLVESTRSILSARARTNALPRILDALPPGAIVPQVGFMLARETTAFRLCAQLPGPEIPAALARLGWSGSPAALAEVLSELLPHAGTTVLLSLDVDGSVGDRVGVELYGQEGKMEAAAFIALFDRLVARGLCRDDERAAILAWHGRSDEVRRGINHVKIVFEPRGAVAAKAYLAFFPRAARSA